MHKDNAEPSARDLTSASSLAMMHRPWEQIWYEAIRHPSVSTYEKLLTEPDAGLGMAYGWMFLMSLVSGVVSGVAILGLSLAFMSMLTVDVITTNTRSAFSIMAFALLTVPRFGVGVLLRHLVAKTLGGKGSYAQLVYLAATYTAPLVFIRSCLTLIPLPGLDLPVLIYQTVLDTIAIKAVHQISWLRAMLAAGIVAILFCLAILALILVFTLPDLATVR